MELISENKRVLGIDISPEAVRLAQIRARGGIKRVEMAVVSADRRQDESGMELLRRGILTQPDGRTCVRARNAVSVLEYQDVTERFLNLPCVDRKKLKELVKWEVPKHTDFPAEEAAWDFTAEKRPGGNEYNVHLAISRKEKVDELLGIILDAGLFPAAVETRSTALHRLVSHMKDPLPGIMALFEIGYRWTTFIIARDGALMMSRRIENGGRDIISSITALIGCGEEDAQGHMLSRGFNEKILGGERVDPVSLEYSLYSAMERPLDNLVSEIKRSYEYFKAQYAVGEDPDRYLLSGEVAMLPNLDRFLSIKLGRDTEVIRPEHFSALEYDVEDVPFPLMSTAVGLALRRC